MHKGKTKVLKYSTENTDPITFDGETLEDVESFTYLVSIIDEQGGSDADVKTRIGKARASFLQLKNIWNSKQISINIKVRIFNTNVMAVLLYAAETWRTTTTITKHVQIFINKAQNALIGWESHRTRVIKASFKTRKDGISVNLIQCYAPTNDYNEDAKDQFYYRLQSIVEKCPTKDLTILMGDLNAKVGMNNTGYEDIRDGKEWEKGTKMIQERRNKKAAVNTSRTRAEKAKAQAEYTEVSKQVKWSIRTDKRKYVEDLATTAEKAARERNMRQLYDITKKLSENRRKPERPVKSKEGEVITNIEEQQNRWVKHFKELLNRPAPLNPSNIEAAPTDLPINVVPPTIEEISMAIRPIKSGKAAGPDNIPAETLKADTKSQLYGSLWNNQLNGICHSTSTSLTTKRHLTAWTEQHYGSFFDTTACLRR
ncbi:unnamed protein product [Schistosoma margrebowiei]|uniref:Uncharacterized protein n=1 Tax=Schistosoma margrebowiei TaxID=48269 RepID=A0A183MLG4_9TREM|nr:unnamed protein product [Schistosoma margrebowiei]